MTDASPPLWHVCSATGAALVNAAPIFDYGIERCERLYVLEGVEQDNAPTDMEREQAVLPARELRRVLAEAGMRQEFFQKRIVQPPSAFAQWERIGREIGADANAHGAEVVLNLKGGTKEMAIGCLIGLQSSGASFTPLMVDSPRGGRPMRLTQLGTKSLRSKPIGARLNLDAILGLQGLKRLQPQPTDLSENQVISSADTIKDFVRAITCNGFDGLIWLMNHIYDERYQPWPAPTVEGLVKQSEKYRPWRYRNVKNAAGQFVTAFAAVHEALWGGPPARNLTETAMKFLTGGWFECAAFLALKDAFPGADVSLQVRIGDLRSAPNEEVTEFDVVLVNGFQPHIVECKTTTFGLGRKADSKADSVTEARAVLEKLATRGRRATGPFGQISVITPRFPQNDAQTQKRVSRVEEAAKRTLIHVYRGPDALQRLVVELRQFEQS